MKIGMKSYAAGAVALAMIASGAIAQNAATITTKTGQIGAPPAGKAQVVFFRPGTIFGVALGCTVHESNREVARLGAGKYYVVTEEPGIHKFSTHGQAADTLDLEIEADETYFVKCKIGSGVVSGAAQLEPSDRESFTKKAKGASEWTPSPNWQKEQGN